MRKLSRMFGGGARAGVLFLALTLAGVWRQAAAVTYGGVTANTTYYQADTTPLILVDNDIVQGFVELAGGVHVAPDANITFSWVTAPVYDDIYLHNASIVNFGGDLHLSTTSLEAGDNVSINAGGYTLFLNEDVALPTKAATFYLNSNLTIDGQGHTLTFDLNTTFSLGGHELTLKNMVIKGLNSSAQRQFEGQGNLKLQNCIIDLASGTTWAFDPTSVSDNPDLYIIDMVVVQGGGTLRFSRSGHNIYLQIPAFSTLYIGPDTTFEYYTPDNNKINMGAATATLHINGGTLKADVLAGATNGILFTTGRVFLEGKVSLDNGTNGTNTNGIQFSDGTNDLTVKVFSGAYVSVNGYLWHNPLDVV